MNAAPLARFLVVVRGAGEMASGAAYRLYRAGLRVALLERELPTAIRREVCFSEAVFDGSKEVEGVRAVRCFSADEAVALAGEGVDLPVLVDPEAASLGTLGPQALVDARMLKRHPGPRLSGPEGMVVVGLGPGHVAGETCDVVVETERGHTLGRVIESGATVPYSGLPYDIAGRRAERVVRAPREGILRARVRLGDLVEAGAVLADVGDAPCPAGTSGRVRGLLRDGVPVRAGQKIGDVDPRGASVDHRLISDKARAVGGGVLEAVLGLLVGRIGRRGATGS